MKLNIISAASYSAPTNNFTYTMNSIPLQVVEQHNYPGVLLDNKLSYTLHMYLICNNANHLLGFLHSNLHHCPLNLKERAYKQIVVPSIEYCTTILWDPYQQISIHKLEMLHCVIRFVLKKPWRKNHKDSKLTCYDH